MIKIKKNIQISECLTLSIHYCVCVILFMNKQKTWFRFALLVVLIFLFFIFVCFVVASET